MEKSGKHLFAKVPMSSPVRRHIDIILWEENNATSVYYFLSV